MGSAYYTANLNYKNNKDVEKALPIINAFITEGLKAEEFWQENRNKTSMFWAQFEKQFPTITDYL